jgi:hypothetical protein
MKKIDEIWQDPTTMINEGKRRGCVELKKKGCVELKTKDDERKRIDDVRKRRDGERKRIDDVRKTRTALMITR